MSVTLSVLYHEYQLAFLLGDCVRDDGSRTVQEYSENILLACTGAGLALPRHSQLCVVSVTVVIAAIVIQMSEVFLFSDGS